MRATVPHSKLRNRRSESSARSSTTLLFPHSMRALARFLLILPLVVWIGSVIFFSFVVAPAAFSLLPTQELAARIVGNSLRTLHYIGLVCGTILLLATLLVDLKRATAVRAAMGLMLLCTAISQFGITPQMQRIRAT